MIHEPEKIFAIGPSRAFGNSLCAQLGRSLDSHEEREFAGGEHKSRALESVRGRDVYVIHSLFGDATQSANDKLCRLLFFIGSIRDAAAGRVTALVPYLAYARKDSKTKARDPVTTRYVAQLFEAVGTDRVVTIDVHNVAAYQNAFRCATEHLEARLPLAERIAAELKGHDCTVVSPDIGGAKRAEAFRKALSERMDGREVPLALMEKQRSRDVVTGELLVGDVAGRTAVLVDDLISSGTTLARAARACRKAGANAVLAAATHAAFTSDAACLAAADALDRLVVTDTITGLAPQALREIVHVVSVAPLFAEAVRRLHGHGSIVELLQQQ